MGLRRRAPAPKGSCSRAHASVWGEKLAKGAPSDAAASAAIEPKPPPLHTIAKPPAPGALPSAKILAAAKIWPKRSKGMAPARRKAQPYISLCVGR